MVKHCEVFTTAVQAFESAALHEIITELGTCKLGKIHGFWYVVWG